ncbi:MAG: MMPL family transporter [Planctomycetes bacterium]|nr:MMPL family transporter [Planctomycetota bacterium]
MPAPPKSSLWSRLCWVLFAAASIFLLLQSLGQRVDPGNRALKSIDTVDATNRRRLQEVVNYHPVVLLAFAMRGETSWLPADRERLADLCQRLLAMPEVASCSLPPSPDPDLGLMPVALRSVDEAVLERVVATAREMAPPSCQVLATGMPLLEHGIATLVAGERSTVVPLLLAVLFGAAWLGYRRLGLAIAVLLPAVTAIAWTSGIVAWCGNELDPVAALLDPVLLTIGVAASVHFVEAFCRARAAGHDEAAARQRAVADLRTPALLATATTMLGLWSLGSSATPAVVDFGVRAAFGVALTHLFTFAMLPAWLHRWGGRPTTGLAAADFATPWVRLLFQRRLPILLTTTVVSVLAGLGLSQLRTDNDPLSMLPAGVPPRSEHDQLAARLGGVEPFHLLVPARSTAADPSRLLPLLAELRRLPGVAGMAGPVQRGAEGDLAVPLLLAPAGSRERVALFADVQRVALALGHDDVVACGEAVQMARDSDRLMQGLLGSLGWSLLALTLAMSLGLRSWRLGLAAMLPNLLPTLWIYGGLGLLQRPVSVATAMIACTMLGLIVDNTLHLLHHYRIHRAASPSRVALRHAFAHCGRAMTLSSVVLMLGFATAATSRLATTVEFAVLATLTIASAWIGTAVLLPLLLGARCRRSTTSSADHAM